VLCDYAYLGETTRLESFCLNFATLPYVGYQLAGLITDKGTNFLLRSGVLKPSIYISGWGLSWSPSVRESNLACEEVLSLPFAV
jgi:hypothetical protein